MRLCRKGPSAAASGLCLSTVPGSLSLPAGLKDELFPSLPSSIPRVKALQARGHNVVIVDMFAADISQPQFPLCERYLWG